MNATSFLIIICLKSNKTIIESELRQNPEVIQVSYRSFAV